MDTRPESIGEFRYGDEPEDAQLDGFKVYGGTPSDRARLQESDPVLRAELGSELHDIIARHKAETQQDSQ